MKGEWLLRFKDGRPLAAEELAPDGSLLRRVEPVWSLRDLCREWGKSRRQVYRDLKDGKAVAVGKFLGEWLLAAAPAPPSGVPEIVAELFPEYASGVLRPRAHRNLILARILSKGGPGRLRWAFARFGEAAVKRFVAERGPRDLDRRSLRFWGLYFGLPQARIPAARSKGREWGGAGL